MNSSINANKFETEELKKTNLIVGLNPALQRTIQLQSIDLIPGEVHRAASVNIGIGTTSTMCMSFRFH